MRMRLATLLALCLLALPCLGVEIAGVRLPDSAQVGGKELALNGAGIRKKFFIKIYVGALYLTQKSQSADEILADPGPKRVLMHFLYKEVDKKKLVDTWTEGFANNLPAAEYAALEPRIGEFNQLFDTVRKGDEVVLDYAPDQGTEVSVAGAVNGVIPGDDFHRAMLRIWLGDKPASGGLKDGMLGK